MKAINNNLLVIVPETPSERKTDSGLFLTSPESESKIIKGVVFHAGDVPLLTGGYRSIDIKAGQQVWFPAFKASQIKHDGTTYHVISEDAVLAVE